MFEPRLLWGRVHEMEKRGTGYAGTLDIPVLQAFTL
jgi:hypothetical protein